MIISQLVRKHGPAQQLANSPQQLRPRRNNWFSWAWPLQPSVWNQCNVDHSGDPNTRNVSHTLCQRHLIAVPATERLQRFGEAQYVIIVRPSLIIVRPNDMYDNCEAQYVIFANPEHTLWSREPQLGIWEPQFGIWEPQFRIPIHDLSVCSQLGLHSGFITRPGSITFC